MKCNECLKELNEMTLYCDRCGAQVSREKHTLTFEQVENMVLPIEIETTYGNYHQAEIRNAFFLSNIRKDFRGAKRNYIEQYIDYVLLFTYYMKNKVHLTTKEFDPQKALALLNTFYNRKPDPKVYELLEEEYGDDFENRVIPKNITDKVQRLYLSDYNPKKLKSSTFPVKTLISTIKGMIKVAFVLALVGAILYLGGMNPIRILLNRPPALIGSIIVIIGVGFISTRKERKYYAFEHIIDSNEVLKKQIKNDMKKRIKTLRYRLKKLKK